MEIEYIYVVGDESEMEDNYGLNKPRSELGKWIDRRGIKQDWLMRESGLNKHTVSTVCNDEDYMPSGRTMQKIIKALRVVDPSVKAGQFWDL
jgi:hypothetical protein